MPCTCIINDTTYARLITISGIPPGVGNLGFGPFASTNDPSLMPDPAHWTAPVPIGLDLQPGGYVQFDGVGLSLVSGRLTGTLVHGETLDLQITLINGSLQSATSTKIIFAG